MVIVDCKVPVQLMFDDRVPDNDNDKVVSFCLQYLVPGFSKLIF